MLPRPPAIYQSTNSSSDSLLVKPMASIAVPEIQVSTLPSASDIQLLHSVVNKLPSKGNKPNFLRLSLLKWLRLNSAVTFSGSGSSELLTLLHECWELLLHDLRTTKLSAVDRSVYLEAVSRTMERREWRQPNETAVYADLLTQTLDLCFTRFFPLKAMPPSINSFIGKLFALSFEHVAGIADVLLFVLFVKNLSIKKVLAIQQRGNTHDCIPIPVPTNVLFEFNPDRPYSNCMLPPAIVHLDSLSINPKDSNWVKKWASYDSDIFCSFLKHYLSFNRNSSHSLLLQTSNWNIILGHIVEIFESSFNAVKKFKASSMTSGSSNSSNVNELSSFHLMNHHYNKDFTKFFITLPIHDLFQLSRFLLNEKSSLLMEILESVLIQKANTITCYDAEKCDSLYEILLQFIIHINLENSTALSINWEFWINGLIRMLKTSKFSVQLKALGHLFNMWSLLPRNYKPRNNDEYPWIKRDDALLITCLSNYLISDEIWNQFFIHWNPLIRHYYYRLVIFKVLNKANLDSFNDYNQRKTEIMNKLMTTYKMFSNSFDSIKDTTNQSLKAIDLVPSNPILNKRLTVIDSVSKQNILSNIDNDNVNSTSSNINHNAFNSSSTNLNSISSSSYITKIYPYDIFDEAIYSTSLGSYSQSLMIRRSESKTSIISTASAGSSISRSSSTSTLTRLPIVSTALNFFKKPIASSPNQSPIQTSPIPEDYRVNSPSWRSTNVLSSPSSMSINSEDDSIKVKKPMNGGLSSSQSNLHVNSMNELPIPPELKILPTEVKRWKYKYQFDDQENGIYKIIKVSKRMNSNVSIIQTPINIEEVWPKRPELTLSSNRNQNSWGLNLSFELDSDDDSSDEFCMIPRTSTSTMIDTSIEDMKEGASSGVIGYELKNQLLLGKFLNEWNSCFEEFKSFEKFLNEHNAFFDDEYFLDPLMILDIPLLKV